MRIVELKGTSHVFTLKDGSAFRIFARQSKPVDDKLVSEDLITAGKMGLVRLIKSETTTRNEVVTNKNEVKSYSKKKNGGEE